VFHVRCAIGHDVGVEGEESLKYCEKAIDLNDERVAKGQTNEQIKAENTYNAAALILNKMDRKEDAIGMYKTGLEVNPECFELLVNAGGLYTDIREDEKAIQFYNRCEAKRAKRACFDKDEHTRDKSREMATSIMATSTTKLTLFHSNLFDSLHSFCSCFH